MSNNNSQQHYSTSSPVETYTITCETCGAKSPEVTDEDSVVDVATDAGWTFEGHNEDERTECPTCQKKPLPLWRVGRKVGNTVYLDDHFVGSAVSPDDALLLVNAANVGRWHMTKRIAEMEESFASRGMDYAQDAIKRRLASLRADVTNPDRKALGERASELEDLTMELRMAAQKKSTDYAPDLDDEARAKVWFESFDLDPDEHKNDVRELIQLLATIRKDERRRISETTQKRFEDTTNADKSK